ncbi:MAG: oxygen-independent coproporphyrinogen III oxidase [Rhodospirillales bacterium]|nr:oxygen-independent coproporphyrinogen III oxidase [Rhodospirillales bacterium]
MTSNETSKTETGTALIDRYDMRVPRYTSYPTAPHFSEAVDDAAYRTWLGALDADQGLSLYFHIPFCDSMCWFCACYTKIVQRYEPIREYLDVLHREIGLVADALPGRLTARHLHWGGGSPTLLTPEDWLALIGALRDRFDVADDAEVAVELDPRDTTEAYVAALAAAGVNRVSIGVQDFEPDTQAAINRIQPFEVVARVCGWLRAHGIQRINLDLMYGLPHQTTARVLDMVDKAVSLDPARLALFGYAHVPWMKSHQRMINEADLPDAAARLDQVSAASRRLQEHGFRAIGLDHFARPDDTLAQALEHGRLHRNFQGYTADTAPVMLGFGASAIGQLPQGYVQNLSPLRDYRRHVEDGRLPVARGLALTPEDRLRGDIIERLMCDLEVDLSAVRARHDGAVAAVDLSRSLDALAPLVADGLVTMDDDRITIPDAGRPFVRLAAAAFDAYLAGGQKRHSRAV